MKFIVAIITLFTLPFASACIPEHIINTTTSTNCFNPLNLKSNCLYDFDITRKTCLVIERTNIDEILSIKSFDITGSLFISLSWYNTPNIDVYHSSVRHIYSDNEITYHKQDNKQDIYHCDKNYQECNFTDTESLGKLYITLYTTIYYPTTGKIKFAFEKPRKNIKLQQLNVIKELWTSCCKPTYKYFEPNLITDNFFKKNCDWSIIDNSSLDNNFGWDLVTTDSCEIMNGVLCDSNGNVQHLELANKNLNCTIPSSFETFYSLQTLYLQYNHISGNISTLSSLPSLIELNIDGNEFYGNISCFANKSINILSIGSNNISGIIPQCYNHYNSLLSLRIGHNPLSIQQFPRLPQSLEFLYLPKINLNGNLYNITKFPNLHLLDISSNLLTGIIPQSIISPKLTYIDCSFNNFTGNLPIFSKKLVNINFRSNRFSGNISKSIQGISLAKLDISHNIFSGYLPSEIATMAYKFINIELNNNLFKCEKDTNHWPKWLSLSKMSLGHCINQTHTPIYPSIQPTPSNETNIGIIIGLIIYNIIISLLFLSVCFCYFLKSFNMFKCNNQEISTLEERSGMVIINN